MCLSKYVCVCITVTLTCQTACMQVTFVDRLTKSYTRKMSFFVRSFVHLFVVICYTFLLLLFVMIFLCVFVYAMRFLTRHNCHVHSLLQHTNTLTLRLHSTYSNFLFFTYFFLCFFFSYFFFSTAVKNVHFVWNIRLEMTLLSQRLQTIFDTFLRYIE